MSTREGMLEKKINVTDEHVRTKSIERRNKRIFSERGIVNNLSQSSPHTPFLPPQAIFRAVKERGLKCTIHS